MLAGFSILDGFMSSTFATVIYVFLAVATAVAILVAYFTGKRLLTVRIGSEGISTRADAETCSGQALPGGKSAH